MCTRNKATYYYYFRHLNTFVPAPPAEGELRPNEKSLEQIQRLTCSMAFPIYFFFLSFDCDKKRLQSMLMEGKLVTEEKNFLSRVKNTKITILQHQFLPFEMNHFRIYFFPSFITFTANSRSVFADVPFVCYKVISFGEKQSKSFSLGINHPHPPHR